MASTACRATAEIDAADAIDGDVDDDEGGDGDEGETKLAFVEETRGRLCSSDVAAVQRGLHDLRARVRAKGSDVDLGLFGVEVSDEDLVPAPLFDDILARFGDPSTPGERASGVIAGETQLGIPDSSTSSGAVQLERELSQHQSEHRCGDAGSAVGR